MDSRSRVVPAQEQELSILELFSASTENSNVWQTDLPTQDFAILRLLLASCSAQILLCLMTWTRMLSSRGMGLYVGIVRLPMKDIEAIFP
jgi:hypothetical protein